VSRVIEARHERFGRSYDEFEVGDVYRHWPAKTITEADDHLFCLLTMAAHPVHLDSEYARTELETGRNLVIGTYIYSLLLGMSVPDTSGRAIAALGTEQLRHLAPLFHGDTLRAETEVLAKRQSDSRPSTGIVTVETRGFKQDEILVCVFRRSFLLPLNS
jgi:acyl dehydratase